LGVVLLLLLAATAFAQDERRVTSPNGRVEFRLFIAVQKDNRLSRIAYEVLDGGKPVVTPSFMGLDIEVQEPLLGENVGLTASNIAKAAGYNTLIAKYMQNGSLGRLINVEARAYNNGIAFRYVLPRSTPLLDFRILEEATEFHLAGNAKISEAELGTYPPMRIEGAITRLAHPFQTATPLTCPWRIVTLSGFINLP
jgi:alpha-glucosidase